MLCVPEAFLAVFLPRRRAFLPPTHGVSLHTSTCSRSAHVMTKRHRRLCRIFSTMASLKVPAVNVPESIKATLQGYQRDGLSWMVHMYNNGMPLILVRKKNPDGLIRCDCCCATTTCSRVYGITERGRWRLWIGKDV